MKRATSAGSIAPAIWLGLCVGLCFGFAAQALAADAGAADNSPSGENNVSAAKPALGRGRAGVAAAADGFGAATHQ